MSDTKTKALELAVSIASLLLTDDAIVLAAGKFETYLNGEAAEPAKTRKPRAVAAEAAAPAATPAAAPAAAPAAPAAPAAVPAAPVVNNGPAPASAASAANGAGPTLQKVADAIIDLANTVSREAAVSVLTKYGAQKVPQIKPADFAGALADAAILKAGGSLDAASAGAGLM